MVPPDSHRVSRAPHYSGYHYRCIPYLYRAVTVYGPAFQRVLILSAANVVVLQPQMAREPPGLG